MGQALAGFQALINKVGALQAAQAKASAANARGVGTLDAAFAKNLRNARNWAQGLQRVGTSLTFTFSLPIAAALGAIAKQEFSFQRELRNLQQVYTDVGASSADVARATQTWARDAENLRQIIMLLSNAFGINRVEVTKMAVILGRAGDAGAGLARDTQTGLILMRAFGLSAEDAAQAVLQLRISYGLTSTQTREALAVLSYAAQATRADVQSLTAAFIKAGPAARQLNIDTRHLVVALATIQQAGFKGAEAGTAFNFALTRLIKPTPEASRLMARLGIDTNSASFAAADGVTRFDMLSNAMKGLTNQQRLYVAATVFGARQTPKLAALFSSMLDPMGTYQQLLAETADQTKLNAYLQNQLAIALKDPQTAFEVLKTNIQNNVSVIGQQLAPMILGLMGLFSRLAATFASFDPGTQRMILISLIIVAMIGPVARLISAFVFLGTLVGDVFRVLLKAFTSVAAQAAATSAVQTSAAAAATTAAGTSASASVLAATAASGAMTVAATEAEVAAGVMTAAALESAVAAGAGATAAVAAEVGVGVASTGIAASFTAAITTIMAPIMILVAIVLAAVVASFLTIAAVAKFTGQSVSDVIGQIAAAIGFVTHAFLALIGLVTGQKIELRFNNAKPPKATEEKAKTPAFKVPTLPQTKALNAAANKHPAAAASPVDTANNVAELANSKTNLAALLAAMRPIEAAYRRQQRVVRDATRALARSNAEIRAANRDLKALRDRANELEDAQRKLGDPVGLRSQAKALREMGRAILEVGDAGLAKRFGDQAAALEAQAVKAEQNSTALDALNAQIKAQEGLIDRLTEARDGLAATLETERERLDKLKDAYDTHNQKIKDARAEISRLNDSIKTSKDNLAGFAAAAAGDMSTLASSLGAEGGTINDVLAEIQKQMGDNFAQGFPNPLAKMKEWFSQVQTGYNAGWDVFSIYQRRLAFGFGGDLWKWIRIGFIASNPVSGIVSLFFDFVPQALSKVRKGIGGRFSDLGNEFVTLFTGAFTRLGPVLAQVFANMFNVPKNTITSMVNFVIARINDMIHALNHINVKIPDIPGVPGRGQKIGFDIADIPYLAKGGVATSPTLAMIAEHGPEAVIPLSAFNNPLVRQMSYLNTTMALLANRLSVMTSPSYSTLGISNQTPATRSFDSRDSTDTGRRVHIDKIEVTAPPGTPYDADALAAHLNWSLTTRL